MRSHAAQRIARLLFVLALSLTTSGAYLVILPLGSDSDRLADGTCGVERWGVKTGTDADAGAIDLSTRVPTTISALRSLPKPSALPSNNRISPTETTVYSISATLSVYKREDDADYHVVITDPSGNTMITELPDPACVGPGSPLAAGIQNARSEFDAQLSATTTFKTANLAVTVTGVGFFDFLHGQTGVAPNGIELHPLLDISFSASPGPTPSPTPPPGSTQCVSSTGPGIPPPASLPGGIAGFHAAWYGQSGYQSLCPGTQATATVAYYNAGSAGWVSGKLGEVAYLGTWNPLPGQDQPSVLGGDGTLGSPNTNWPRYNRVALQPASYVGPGQVAWFQFTVQAPTAPGRYTLAIRPLIEGAQWMEDYGVFWYVTVLNADGSAPPPPPSPTPTPTPTPPTPSAGTACQTAPSNPWGYDFCAEALIYAPPSNFCSYFNCIASFWNGVGYVVECNDATFSLSGGRSGACSYHGGSWRALYAH